MAIRRGDLHPGTASRASMAGANDLIIINPAHDLDRHSRVYHWCSSSSDDGKTRGTADTDVDHSGQWSISSGGSIRVIK